MPTDLHDLLNAMHDEASFLVFVRALLDDRLNAVEKERDNPSSPYGPDAGGWENTSIEHFLDGALAWAEASNVGLSQGLTADNPWLRFANFLYCGKIYE